MFKSALDDLELTKESFEDAISCGCKTKEIMDMFGITYNELLDWCYKEYGRQYEFVYQVLRSRSLKDYKQVLKILAARGNNTAISTLNQFVYDMNEEEKVQKIQIVGSVPDSE